MHGWGLVLVLALVNLIIADALVWFVIAQGWPQFGRPLKSPPGTGTNTTFR